MQNTADRWERQLSHRVLLACAMFCCMLRGFMSPLRFLGSFMPFIAAAGRERNVTAHGHETAHWLRASQPGTPPTDANSLEKTFASRLYSSSSSSTSCGPDKH